MDSLTLQEQIRNNADELKDYLKDLSLWNKEMKRKEDGLQVNSSCLKEIPPVRSKKRKMNKSQDSSKLKKEMTSGCDYSAKEKFNVEKACEEVDADSSESEPQMEVSPQVLYRLMEEASYEKEMGNQHVKSQKWDDAIKCYTRAIKCYPHDAVYYANRALCFLKIKDFRSAETDCTSALQLDDTYVKAYHRRAAARTELNQLQEAVLDLRRVLELEPGNQASRQELAKLEAKMVKSALQVPRSRVSVNAVPGTSGLPGIKKPVTKQAKCSTNQGIADKEKNVVSTEPTKQTHMVQPIYKPPHLRSKKILRRIKIEDFDSSSNSDVTELVVQQNQASQNTQIARNKKDRNACGEGPSTSVPTSGSESPPGKPADGANQAGNNESSQMQVPPAPVSSVQFLVGWNKVKGNSKLMYMYLKQICGAELPKLFQDSLESNIFSSILATLGKEFVEGESPIYSYLLGLSKVRRFSTLSFFLSKEEKECVSKLLDHCVSRGECTISEASHLKEKYEL